MTEQEFHNLRFPIGECQIPEAITSNHINGWINDIVELPDALVHITENLSETALNYKYRPKGWTIKQVIHHCADSHMNSLIRFKLALTEHRPTIRPYFEDRFAKLADYNQPIDSAIAILKGVHQKLGIMLRALDTVELKREFIHPEHNKTYRIEEAIGLYAWHSNHHIAHINQALKNKGQFN
ncbi:YfiT family bacillithiol transferase [Winogradskyella alexanderae]|uniref:Metal-dependent hydrolase n=1 Tax=Winogradskyella alexanderae TaxID=2877123 RepID=A0ABS7XUR7_9FLAO|nr:putative metal-dependent hydrolase [Winogradskyella alexanderae]MCA0133775.1 putative metal-dependent hydrolase [Winogradskyella alexanderae]